MSSEHWSPGRGRYQLFASAILMAAAVRLYLLWHYYCISSDGVHYIDAAKDFFAGRISAGLSSVYPPAYPLLIASLYPFVGDWELSGQIWSLVSGVLLLFPLYIICREMYGDRVALGACFLAAFGPYLARYSVHVRTESLFLLLSVTALLLFHQGVQLGFKSRFFYGGLLAGFAYLVRPEAIGFLAIVPAVLGLQWWIKRDRTLSWLLKACFILVLGFAFFAAPYVVYLSLETGHWGAVSRKAGVTLAVSLKESGLLDAEGLEKLPDLESLSLVQFVSRYPFLYMKKVTMDLLPSVGVYFEALHYSYVPFLLLGLFIVFREGFWERKDFLLFVFLVFYLIGFALIYVNRRYSVQLVPASLGWTAMGMLWCWAYFKRSLSLRAFRAVSSVVAVIFIAGTLPKTLKPISPEKAHVREAGRYLKGVKGSRDLKLLVFDDRIAFYAEAKPILLGELPEPKLLERLRQRTGDYLATERGPWQERYPRIAQNPGLYGLVLEREFEVSGKDRLMIFKLS